MRHPLTRATLSILALSSSFHSSSNGVSLPIAPTALTVTFRWQCGLGFQRPLLPQKDFDKFSNPLSSSTHPCYSMRPLSSSPSPKQFFLYKFMRHPSPHTHLVYKLYSCNTCWDHSPSHRKFFLNQTNEAGIIVQFTFFSLDVQSLCFLSAQWLVTWVFL